MSEKLINTIPLLKKIFPVVAGAVAGYAYWHFIGCTTGSCAITSNWQISTAYGALVGVTFLLPGKSSKRSPSETSKIEKDV